MTDIELLVDRVRTLERRFRTMKLIAAFVCIAIMAIGTMGQAPKGPRMPLTINQTPGSPAVPAVPIEEEVRSRHFVLVDGSGKERASLVTDNAGSVFLVMADAAGKTRVSLSNGTDGTNLTFFDPSGQPRTIIGSTALIASHVNDKGVVERAPASSLALFDGTGKLLFRTP
jgi:hypothetical protein